MVITGAGVAGGFARSLPKEYAAKARVMLDVGNEDPNQFSLLQKNTEAAYIGTEMRLITDDGVLR